MKKLLLCCVIIMCMILCACQKSPNGAVIASKNDGSFDIGIVQHTPSDHQPDSDQQIVCSEEFYSSDGSVLFRIKIDENVKMQDMPVVEVVPHFISEGDAERVAVALFGNAEFYEADTILTKTDIMQKIQRWSLYLDRQLLTDLLGEQEKKINKLMDFLRQEIEMYTDIYDRTSEDLVHKATDWTYKKESYFRYTAEEFQQLDTTNENDAIRVVVKKKDIPYTFSATTRNKNDYKLNSFFSYPYDGISPEGIDSRIFQAMLCRTDKPTDEQIEQVKSQAEQMLEEMGLGDWFVDQCYVERTYYGDVPEYVIHVNAVPVLNGVAAVRRPQLTNLKSEEVYASNYYLTDVNFQFSANGELIYFNMLSPIDIKSTVNSNVAVMDMSELLERAKQTFSLSDYYEYGFGSLVDHVGEKVSCVAEINDIDFGLTRVKVPDTDESYYYVPCLLWLADISYLGDKTSKEYYSAEGQVLLIMNAIDGTIINATNE